MSAKLLTFPQTRRNTILCNQSEKPSDVWHRVITNPEIEKRFKKMISGCARIDKPVEAHILEMLDLYQDIVLDTLIEDRRGNA